MTLQELTYDLKELIRNAHIIDDERIDDRLLHLWIHQQRALLAKQYGDKGIYYEDPLLQDYIIPLEFLKTESSKSNILRTTFQVESVVPLKFGNSILEIRGNDFAIEGNVPTPNERTITNNMLSVVPWNQLRVAGEGRFTSKNIFVALRDGYYYIKYGKDISDRGHLKEIVIRGVFENPTVLPDYNIFTSKYPMSLSMINILKRIILQTDLTVVLGTKSDDINNGSGDVAELS